MFLSYLTIPAFLLLISTVLSANYFENEGLSEMSNINIEPLFNSQKHILAYFTNTLECDELCQERIRLIKDAAEQIKDKVEFELVFINVKESKRVTKTLRVVDIPSIAYLANSKAVIYNGDVDVKELLVWLKKRIILPSEPFSSNDDSDKLKTKHNRVVQYAGLRNKYYQIYRYVASSYDDLAFAHSFSAPVLQSQNRTVSFYKHLHKTAYILPVPFTAGELTEFIDRQYYNLQSLDSLTLKRIMTVEPYTLLLIHIDPACDELLEFRRAADTMWEEVLSVSTPLTETKGMKKLVRFLGTGPKYEVLYPVLRIIERKDDRIFKYKYEGEITQKNIKKFFRDFKSGILRPYFKSEKPIESEGSVKTLVGTNFDDAVFDNLKDVVVFFHSVWCVECSDIMPMYSKVAENLASSESEDVLFSKIDTFNNEGMEMPEAMAGEPIIRIYRADDKEHPIEFEGNFVTNEIETWIKKNLYREMLSADDL